MSDWRGSGRKAVESTPVISSSVRAARKGHGRTRYTHKLVIHSMANTIFSGDVGKYMTPSASQPDKPFKLEVTPAGTSTITGLKIVGLVDGVSTTENMTCNSTVTKYSENYFDSVISLGSRGYYSGSTITISSVDEAYQPIYWEVESGPYGCVFSTTNGMSAGMQQLIAGLDTYVGHYVRVEYSAPVHKNMEFTVTPGYEGREFVPITDFDVICIPPKFVPVEWAFRAYDKEKSHD